jgi:hypothetical protein
MKMKGTPMKIKRHLAPVAGALLLVTGGASIALLGGGEATAAGTPSSAFGLELNIAGNTALDRTPSVVSTDGKPVTDSLVDLPVAPLLDGGLVVASAQNGSASAKVTGLGVGQDLLNTLGLSGDTTKPLVDACKQITDALAPVGGVTGTINDTLLKGLDDALTQIGNATSGTGLDLSALGALKLDKLLPTQLYGLCEVLSGKLKLVGADSVVAECNGKTGNVTIAGLKALGLPVEIGTDAVNKKVEIPGLLNLTINRQTANADGTFTVDALYLNLLGQVELTVSSATCGNVTTNEIEPSDAPSPTPVESHVPVTG